MSALFASEMFRLFVNTLNPDENYSRRYVQIFWQQLQRPFSQKGIVVFQFWIALLKCAWNLEHSQEKEGYFILNVTEIIATERDVYLSV